ncbi:MAG: hypothetical protein ABSF71_03460 [Terriglobia bacterium]|jgi:hypothetical protein
MDKTALVRNDQEIEGLIMEALSRIKMPVTLLRWNFVPELDEWQLVIATPWYDLKGPRATYGAVIDAFQEAGIYEDVPMRRIFLKSPNDDLVKAIEKESTEGTIHVLKERRSSDAADYSVVFAPFLGQGGFIPEKRFPGTQELRSFLVGTLRIRQRLVDEALEELDHTRSAAIYPVSLSERELKRAGLA